MRFLSKFLKRWYLYIIPMLVFPVVATIYAKQTQTIYETSALLYVQSPNSITGSNPDFNPYNTPAQNGASLMNELMQSNNFVAGVATLTDLANQYDLSSRTDKDLVTARIRGDVVIASGAGSNNVFLVVDDKSPKIALQIAQSLISSFSTYFEDQRLAQDQKSETFLTQQINIVKAKVAQDLAAVNQYQQTHPGTSTGVDRNPDPQLQTLQQQLLTDASTEQTLVQQLNSIKYDEAAASTDASKTFNVLDDPLLPLKPTLHLKKLALYAAGGFAAALALVGLIVGLQTMRDRRVYSILDLRNIVEQLELEIPAFNAIPVIQSLGPGRGSRDDDILSAVLVPILTVLPQQGDEASQENRRTVGTTAAHDE